MNGGSFGSEAKNFSAEKRSCSSSSEKAVTGLFDERKPASAKRDGPSSDRAEACLARAPSLAARAFSTEGAPAASAAASRSVSGSEDPAPETVTEAATIRANSISTGFVHLHVCVCFPV